MYIESLNPPTSTIKYLKRKKKKGYLHPFHLYRLGTGMATRKENEENKENIKNLLERFIEKFFYTNI